MNTEYRVIFKYHGKTPNIFEREAIEQAYIAMYNEFCDRVNPLLEKWNDAEDCPDDAADEVGSNYYRYIIEKESAIVDLMNIAWVNHDVSKMIPIKEFFIGGGCNFCARLNDGTTVEFYLKA